jgi:hypothetical protein
VQLKVQNRSKLISVIAFLQRGFARSLGIYRDPQFGIDIENRARRYRALL